jgi:hypothetical protein
LIDIFINYINSLLEKRHPYKILIIYNNKSQLDKFLKIFKDYPIYHIDTIEQEKVQIKENEIKLIKLPFDKYDIIISLGQFDKDFLQKIADRCRINGKLFYHIDNSFFLEDLIYQPSRLGPILAFEYKPSPLDGRKRVIKRIFDIVFSITFILFFWWLYLLIALFIWIKDGRPIIYKSKRVGKG